jgi:TRAP transporter 4TM/12TM fusion protein
MRSLNKPLYLFILALACLSTGLHYYWSGFGGPEPRIIRGIHLLILLPSIYILFPATKRSPKTRPSVPDVLALVCCVAAIVYILVETPRLNKRFFTVSDVRGVEAVLGWLLALLCLEAVRRSISKWFAATVLLVLAYLVTCEHWPGMFYFQPFSLARAAEILYLGSDDGMFGFLTGISVELLYVYILFAGVMMLSGAGDFLVELSFWLAGWAKGGPAKVAVIASALYGTISGSSVANVYATGSFTIPLMKRGGYTPKQAAAVESVAGVGGQIMPPIMGAGAFIMAEITGISYFKIIVVAAIPAVLYYFGLFAMVHFIAVKQGLAPLPKDQRPRFRQVLGRSYFILPFLAIVGLLAAGYSPAKAAFHTVWFTLLLSFLDRQTWPTYSKVTTVIVQSFVSGALIASVLAGAGMTVGILTQTGAALAFSSIVVSLAHNNLLICLFLVFALISVLGTGIPTTPAYIIAVAVAAMALGKFGVPVLAAHLFVFYYAVLSDVTPPDAVTAFAAANLAGSEPMSTGFQAFTLGFAGFLVPFAFVLNPELLLSGTAGSIVLVTLKTMVAVLWLAGAIIGHFVYPLTRLQRCLFAAAAILFIWPEMWSDIAALILIALARPWRRNASPTSE